ncbi:hypothetical protein Ancab_003347 [Ancistrocladus abbreviatus]
MTKMLPTLRSAASPPIRGGKVRVPPFEDLSLDAGPQVTAMVPLAILSFPSPSNSTIHGLVSISSV